MSSRETSMEEEDYFVSNTNATIYAASDISGWTQSLISDNNIPNSSFSTSVDENHNHHQQISTAAGGDDDSMIVSSTASTSWFMNNKKIDNQQEIRIFNVDFRAICDNRLKSCPGSEFRGDTDNEEIRIFGVDFRALCNKRLKSSSGSELRGNLVNEETRLVNMLMACAEAIQENNLSLADVLISDIRRLAVSQIGAAMKKVATYFAEALDGKIHRTNPQYMVESSYSKDQLLRTSFYESCPLLKIAHFTANQSILEAFADSKRVHVIDFSLNQGMQWSALLQALALRPGGPPVFRLSGIGGHLQFDDSTDPLQKVGLKLAKFAESIGVEFEFCGYMTHTLADLKASVFDIRPSNVEAVAVNSVFELHRVFSIPGAVEKELDLINQIQPKIVTITIQEANHNRSVFMNRIKEAWYYYSTVFNKLENSATYLDTPDVLRMEQYLGGEINNLVACEGTKRAVRHETLGQWRVRFNSARFNLVPLASNKYKQAAMLLALFSNGEGYKVEEQAGCLMLTWHSCPLIIASTWWPCRQV